MYAQLTTREMYTFRRRRALWLHTFLHTHFRSFAQAVHLIPNSAAADGETISEALHLFQCLIP